MTLKGLTDNEKTALSWAARVVQGVIVILIAVVGYFTGGLIEDTKRLSETLNQTNRELLLQMDSFSEKIAERIHDLDKRVTVLEDREARSEEKNAGG